MKFKQFFSEAYKSRFSGIMTVLLVITAICSLYYFYYLDEREAVLDKHYNNSLRHIESRMNNSCQGYQDMADANTLALYHLYDNNTSVVLDDEKLLAEYSAKIKQLKKNNHSALIFRELDPGSFTGKAGNNPCKSQARRKDSTIIFRTFFNYRDGHIPFESTVSIPNLLHSASKGSFDELVLTLNDTIHYETAITGFQRFIPDSLDIRDDKSAAERKTPTIHCAGENYRCYELPTVLYQEKGWKLIGLVAESRFEEEKHHMPRSLRFTAFLIVVLVVLAIPFIKIFIMSRTERLKISDVVFAVFSFMLSIALVTVLLFDGYLQYNADTTDTRKSLRNFSGQLERNLTSEINFLRQELKEYKTKLQNDKFNYSDYSKGGLHIYGNLFLANQDSLSWLDSHDKDLMFKVGKRKYFSDILNKKFSYLGQKSDSSQYVIESITSWREGKQRMAISIPCDSVIRGENIVAAVITTDLLSLSHTVLPRNSGFCMIDASGEILAHSDSSKILSENFLDETDRDPYIEAAIHARREFVCTTQYAGDPIRMIIRPLKGSPYFIVAYVNNGALDAIHGQVFGMAMVMETSLILVYLIIGFLVYFTARKRSRLKAKRYNFRFFLPGYHTENQFYRRACIFNLTMLLMMSSVSLLSLPPLLTLFMFFGAPIGIILFNYLLTVFTKKNPKFTINRKYIALIATGICAVNFAGICFLQPGHYALFVLYQLITIGLFVFSLKIPLSKSDWPGNRMLYRLLVFFLVLLITVLPASCFTVLAYNTENEIAVKAVQQDLFRSSLRQSESIRTEAALRKTSGNYMNAFYDSKVDAKTEYEPECDTLYQLLCARMRGSIQKAYTENLLLGGGSSDHSWSWGKAKGRSGRLVFEVNSSAIVGGENAASYRISSQPRVFHLYNFGNNDTWGAFTAWLVFLFMLLLLFYILHLFIRHMFAPESHQIIFGNIDKKFFGENNPSYRIFVNGVPCCGKTRYFEKLLSDKDGYQHLDFIRCLDVKWDDEVKTVLAEPEGVLLIDHFEYDCLNPEVNKIKLKLLEQLAGLTKKRVVIISSIPIQGFLEFYESRPERDEPAEKEAERLQEVERWNKVLGNYYNFWFPIRGMNNIGEPRLKQRLKPLDVPEEIKKTIIEECDHGFFLRKIGEELCQNMGKKEHRDYNRNEIHYSKETIVLKVQQIAHSYYLSIWSQLTKEEQYVLFDIAQDGLVNPKNSDVVEILSRKGLVIYGSSVQPMNRSFQNFILTVVETSDLMKLEHSKRDSGNWERLRKPLLIAVIALILFILKTDQSETFTWITGFAAGVPLVINLLGFFMKGEVAKE